MRSSVCDFSYGTRVIGAFIVKYDQIKVRIGLGKDAPDTSPNPGQTVTDGQDNAGSRQMSLRKVLARRADRMMNPDDENNSGLVAPITR
jgi:hypothetical protein